MVRLSGGLTVLEGGDDVKITAPRLVKKWRVEWLLIALAIALHGFAGAFGYSVMRMIFPVEIPLAESKTLFAARMTEAEPLLHKYTARTKEYAPEWDQSYRRSIDVDLYQGWLNVSMENSCGIEKYIMKMDRYGKTPLDALPNAESVLLATRLFSIASGGAFAPEPMAEALSVQIDIAYGKWAAYTPSPDTEYRHWVSQPLSGAFSGEMTFCIYERREGFYATEIRWAASHYRRDDRK